jgi:hypothetical protein
MSTFSQIKDAFLNEDSLRKVVSGIQKKVRKLNDKDIANIVHTMEQIATVDFFMKFDSLTKCREYIINEISTKFPAADDGDNTYESYSERVIKLDGSPGDSHVTNLITSINTGSNAENDTVQKVSISADSLQSIMGMLKQLGSTQVSAGGGSRGGGGGYNSYTQTIELTLDTKNRLLSEYDPGTRNSINWVYSSSNTSNWIQGSVISIYQITQIFSVDCGVMYIPMIENTTIDEFKQVSMFISEFSSYGTYTTAGIRYHFLFSVERISTPGSGRLKLTPVHNNTEMLFDPAITQLSTLSVSFATPFEKIIFGRDRDVATVTTGSTTLITTAYPHGLNNGDLVSLAGFTTGNTAVDNSTIILANSAAGYTISNITSYTFTIASLDTSTVTLPVSITTVHYLSKRFIIPLRFRTFK